MIKFFFYKLTLSLLLFSLTLQAQESKTSTQADVKPVPIPEYWDHFVIMPWQINHKVQDNIENYKKLNLHAFHIDRSNSTQTKVAKEQKWSFYVDHAADKGFLYLNKKTHADLKNAQKANLNAPVARPFDLASPSVISEMKKHMKNNINAAKDAYPLAYAYDDEISMGIFCGALETSGNPDSIKFYRTYLETLYEGDIKKLNQQYGTSYNAFNEVNPTTYEGVRSQVKANNLHKLNLSPWQDFRSAMDTLFTDTLKDLSHYSNSLDPKVPGGFVGGQAPSAYGGYDWRKMSKSVQWAEAYESGGNNEMIRSFWGQEKPLLKTYFIKYTEAGHPRDKWFLWYYMCHGNRGVIVWADKWFQNGGIHPIVEKLADTMKEVQGEASKMILNGTFQYDQVGIYYSHPSVQATWALDAQAHGKTWPNRSNSMDNNLATSHLTRIGWHKGLEDIGLQAKYFHKDHLLAGDIQKQGFKVLVLNRVLCLSDEEIKALEKFVEEGGTLIADHMAGIMDEHGKSRTEPGLAKLFGISQDLSKGLINGSVVSEYDGDSGYKGFETKFWQGSKAPLFNGVAVIEKGLKATTGKGLDHNGTTIMVENKFGKGKTLYMNLSTVGFLLERNLGKGFDFLVFLEKTFKDLGIQARLDILINGKKTTQIESVFWKSKNGKNIVCILKNPFQTSDVNAAGETGEVFSDTPETITLKFKTPIKNLVNFRTDKKIGNGSEFKVEFKSSEALIFTYE